MIKLKLSKIYFLLIPFLFVVSTGCSTTYGPSGQKFAMEDTYKIVKGMSEEEVLSIIKTAPHERLVLDGRETWIWVFSDNSETETFSVSLYKNKVEDTFEHRE